MAHTSLRIARERAGLSQQTVAARLGVSQPYYSQIEGGTRPAPPKLASLIVARLGTSACFLALPALCARWRPISADRLTAALAALGYPAFGHMRRGAKAMNPALVLVGSLAHHDLDVRIIEALPWLLAEFADLDTPWIVSQTRLLNLQNRVGYLVTLADQGATPARHLSVLAAEMESSRLASEGTLCRDSMPTAERTWVRKNRPALAAHWRLLTTLTREQLSYAL